MTSTHLAALTSSELSEQSQNSLYLKAQGLDVIRQLTAQTWTDHNPADPGITLLDVLAFVISDLSYKLHLPIRDLLAADPDKSDPPNPFYLAPEVLPSSAVTLADQRKVLLDIPGVRNAEILPDPDYAGQVVNIRVDLDDEITESVAQQAVYQKVQAVFLAHRQINQDLNQLILTEKQALVVGLTLVMTEHSDPVDTLVDVFQCIQQQITRRYFSKAYTIYSNVS